MRAFLAPVNRLQLGEDAIITRSHVPDLAPAVEFPLEKSKPQMVVSAGVSDRGSLARGNHNSRLEQVRRYEPQPAGV